MGRADVLKLLNKNVRWVLAISLAAVTITAGISFQTRAATCNLNATAANFASQFTNATSGQTVCLTQSTDYGKFNGGAKPGMVTVTPDAGVVASLSINFNNATNITVDGTLGGGSLTIHNCVSSCNSDGNIMGTSANIILKNARFDHRFAVNKTGSGAITVDNADFNQTVDDASIECRFCAFGDGTNATIKNSLFKDGAADGIRADGDNWTVGPGNRFITLKDVGANHTDPIQICCGGAVSGHGGSYPGPGGQHIVGNYFDQSGGTGNVTTYIGIYDSAHDVIIEDNVFRAIAGGTGGGYGYGYAIDLLSDTDSIIRHNTAERGTCDFNIPCGTVQIGHKSSDNAGAGTHIYDNVIANLSDADPTQTADHNLVRTSEDGTGNSTSTPVFAGPNTTYAGFLLAGGSPGKGAGVNEAGVSDGSDIGIRAGADGAGPPVGDLNQDGSINQDDLDLLVSDYGKLANTATTPEADLNGDGKINIKDMSIMLRNWTG